MARGLSTLFVLRPRRLDFSTLHQHHHHGGGLVVKRRKRFSDSACWVKCCCSDSVLPIRRNSGHHCKSLDKPEDWAFDPRKSPRRLRRTQPTPAAALPFASSSHPSVFASLPSSGSRIILGHYSNISDWWEKSDWTGYRELGVEKSGRNAEGDSWWETWREVLRQDEWRTDKWAETELGTKWEEKFFAGIGSRQGETWHFAVDIVKDTSQTRGCRLLLCWSRTWGEEHFGNGKVHKYGKSRTGESWDIVVDEETCYEAEPHYGWADVVGNSSQLLSISPLETPPGVFPNLDFGSSPSPSPSNDDPPELPSSPSQGQT